jgi:hypothetical protein
MFQKIKHKTAQLTQQRHDQFADFKHKIRSGLNEKFPAVKKDLDDKHLETPLDAQTLSHIAQQTFSTHRIIVFWGIGLLFVVLGFFLYNTLSYLYMLIAACILSLAVEGLISFFARLTRSRGV